MPEYRAFLTRTRTIQESIVVTFNSTSEHYAQKDAAGHARREEWNVDRETASPAAVNHLQEL